MSKFESNCRYFERKNPRASALLTLVDASHLQLTKTALDELNLQDTRRKKEGKNFYHSEKGALKEQEEALSSLDLQKAKVVCIYGVGLGYAYFALQFWLRENKEHKIVFLEDDLAVILRFLESKQAETVLKDPQVHLYYIEPETKSREVLQEIAWGIYPLPIAFAALPYYAEARKGAVEEIKNRLFYEETDLLVVLEEYVTHGVPFFRNFWPNLFLLPDAYKGNKLFDKFKNIPALLIAAGPSLSKHLDALRSLKDHALFFAGGSTVNALNDAGIRPHFAGAIDPNPTQYLRIRQGLAFEVPFFYRQRVLHEALSMITGPKLYLTGGDGYNISEWFEKKLKIHGRILGGGHSIANFLIEIAYALGCRTIILVGYDLAHTGEESYAAGVLHGEIPVGINAPKEEKIEWRDYQGKPIRTYWKWIIEAKWITDFQKKHPRLKIYNATEGGIQIEGVPNITLKEAEELYLKEQQDYDGFVHTQIQTASQMSFTQDDILKEIAVLYDSLARSVTYIDDLVKEIEKVKKSRAAMPPLEKPSILLLLEKLEAEPAFDYILEVFHRMRCKLDFYALHFSMHPTLKDADIRKKEIELLISHYSFLKEVALVNQLLIAQTIKKRAEEGHSISAFHPKAHLLMPEESHEK
jgi:hypothetical protein